MQEDKLNALIKAAGVSVEPFWPSLFAKVSMVNGRWGLSPAGFVVPTVLHIYLCHMFKGSSRIAHTE